MSTVQNSFPQSVCLVIGNILRLASIQSIFLSVPVDLLVCVVPLLGKEIVANKRECLKMAEFEKCAFFKDIIKYHGNNDCYDYDDIDGTWHMARGKEEGGLADGGVKKVGSCQIFSMA